MKRIIIGGAILIIAVVAALLLFSGKGGATRYQTEAVTRGEIVQSVSATGTVNPVTTVLVGTQVSGKIKALYADFNSVVKKGQLIAQIDPALFQAAVDQAQASLANAKANLVKNQATLVDAQRTRDRYKDLLARHLVSQSDLDTAETNYETAKATVDASGTQISQAQAALSQTETNLVYTEDRFARGRDRHLPERRHRPDRGRELPDAHLVHYRRGPDQDADRHERR